jgi:hypothetical protein
MNEVNEKLKQSCQDAIEAFKKLNDESYAEIQEKLEWCIGSYDFDKNPSGLYEYGAKSLDVLKSIKEMQPRKVSKKLIDTLEKALKNFSEN